MILQIVANQIGFLGSVDGDNDQASFSIGSLELDESRHLLATGRAPEAPEVEEHDLAFSAARVIGVGALSQLAAEIAGGADPTRRSCVVAAMSEAPITEAASILRSPVLMLSFPRYSIVTMRASSGTTQCAYRSYRSRGSFPPA